MTILSYAAGWAAALAASWLLTGVMRQYAIRVHLMDEPNSRSSHQVATPRGGGVAFVITFLGSVLALSLGGLLDRPLSAAALGSGVVVAALGYIDDREQVSARTRFAGHLAAAVWVLGWLGPIPEVPVFGVSVDLGISGVLLAGLFLVWMINLFNFMDGIDGIASAEAISVCLGGALVWWTVQPDGPWGLAVLFAACVAGFLVWNYPPARIFMGDAGSGFLGLVVALLALWSSRTAPLLFWSWFILIGCFMVDATTTLLRRVRRGEKFHQAHRSHAYQHASRAHGSHKAVTLAVALINTAWLLPIAILVATSRLDGVLGCIVAYAPLVWLAFRYKAGDHAAQDA
jgi:Fuc2NAc and GlcNAc transferase